MLPRRVRFPVSSLIRYATGRVGLALPFFLLAACFWAVPLAQEILLSLQADTLWGGPRYVGLDHYRALLIDRRFWKAATNTAWFAFSAIPLILLLALVIANGLRRCSSWLRGPLAFAFVVPGLCPPAVLSILFLLVFHGQEGLLNRVLLAPLGWEPVNWLADPDFILAALVLQAVWRWTGFITFFVLSALDALPRVIFDAAKLDGASGWQSFRVLTLPLIAPILGFCVIYLLVDCFTQFAGSYLLLGGSGGTDDAGLLLISYAYQRAFVGGSFGSAAAISLATVPILLIALLLAGYAARLLRRAVQP